MKNLVLFLLAALLVADSYAQNNVNVDNYRYNFTYRALPSKPLNPLFFYYKASINAPNSLTQLADIDLLLEKLNIEGQRRTDEIKPGDVDVVLNMESVNIVSSDLKERIEELTDKDGKITGRNYYYSILVTYTFASGATVAQDGKNIGNYFLYSRNSPLTYQSKEYGSSKEASDFWKNNRENLRENFTRDLATSSVNNLSTRLTALHGFPTTKTSDIIKTIDEKKHPENEAFRATGDKLKANLEAIDANTPMQETNVADLIDYYKNILVRYTDPKLKADVRLRYAALYNLCKIYLALDQPQNVQQYADVIFTNGHDKGDAKKMNEAAEKLSVVLNSSDVIKTRHFDPNTFFED